MSETKEEIIPFHQRDILANMIKSFGQPLVSGYGICSELSDLFIYYHEMHVVTKSGKYKDFLDYILSKLTVEKIDNLDNFVIYTSILQEFGNSIWDRLIPAAESKNITRVLINENTLNALHEIIDKVKCVNFTIGRHSYSFIKNENNTYTILNANEGVISNATKEFFNNKVLLLVDKYKSGKKGEVVYVQDARSRITEYFGITPDMNLEQKKKVAKEYKKALRDIFELAAEGNSENIKEKKEALKKRYKNSPSILQRIDYVFGDVKALDNTGASKSKDSLNYLISQYKRLFNQNKIALLFFDAFINDKPIDNFDYNSFSEYQIRKILQFLNKLDSKVNFTKIESITNIVQEISGQNLTTDVVRKLIEIYNFDKWSQNNETTTQTTLAISDSLIKYRIAKILQLLDSNPNIKHIEICSVKVKQKEAIFILQNLKEVKKVKKSMVENLAEIYNFEQHLQASIDSGKLIIFDDLIEYRKAEIINFLSTNNVNIKDVEISSVRLTQEQAIFVLQNLKEGETVNNFMVQGLAEVYNFDKYLQTPVVLDKLIISDYLIEYRKAEIINFLSTNNVNIKDIEISSVEVTQEQAIFVLQNLKEGETVNNFMVQGLVEVYNFDKYLQTPVVLDKLIISDYLIGYRKAEIINFLSTNNVNIKDIEICSVKVTQEQAKFVLQNLKENKTVNEFIVQELVEVYNFDKYLQTPAALDKLIIPDYLIKYRTTEIIKFLNNNVNVEHIEICSVQLTQEEAKLILYNLKENGTVNKIMVQNLVEIYRFDQCFQTSVAPEKLKISQNLIDRRKAEIINFLSTNNVNIKDIEISSVEVTQEQAKFVLQNLKENKTVNEFIVQELIEVYNFDKYLQTPAALDKLIIPDNLIKYRTTEIIQFLNNNVNVEHIEICSVQLRQKEAKLILQNLKENGTVNKIMVQNLVEIYRFDQCFQTSVAPVKLIISENLIERRKAEIINFLSTNNVNINNIKICSLKVTQEEAKFVLQNLKENKTVNEFIVQNLVEIYRFDQCFQTSTAPEKLEISQNLIDRRKAEIINFLSTNNVNINNIKICSLKVTQEEAKLILQNLKEGETVLIYALTDLVERHRFDQCFQTSIAPEKLKISQNLIKQRKAEIIKFLSNNNINVEHIKICSVKVTQEEAIFVLQNLKENESANQTTVTNLVEIYRFDQCFQTSVAPEKLKISQKLIEQRKAEIIKFLSNNNINIKDIEICSVEVTQEQAIFVLQNLKEGETVRGRRVTKLVEAYKLDQLSKNQGLGEVTKLEISDTLLESCKLEGVIASMQRSVNVTSLDMPALDNNEDIAPLISVAASKFVKLECLNVANNTLDDKSTAALIELIQNTKTLIALDISDIKLSEKNAEKLADAIAKNNTIQLLEISGITVEGASVSTCLFVPIIEKNSSVKVIRARHCKFDSTEFLDAMKHNKSIEVLDLLYSKTNPSSIIKMRETNSNVVLRNNSEAASICFNDDMLTVSSKAKKEQVSSPSQGLENPVASTMETSKTVL